MVFERKSIFFRTTDALKSKPGPISSQFGNCALFISHKRLHAHLFAPIRVVRRYFLELHRVRLADCQPTGAFECIQEAAGRSEPNFVPAMFRKHLDFIQNQYIAGTNTAKLIIHSSLQLTATKVKQHTAIIMDRLAMCITSVEQAYPVFHDAINVDEVTMDCSCADFAQFGLSFFCADNLATYIADIFI